VIATICDTYIVLCMTFLVVLQYGSSPVSTICSFSTGSAVDDFKEDPFKSKDPFGGTDSVAVIQADPFQSEDPFQGSECTFLCYMQTRIGHTSYNRQGFFSKC